MYVDDCLFLGDQLAIHKAVKEIKEKFIVTTSGTLQDFLGACITINNSNTTTYLDEPFLSKKMIDKFKTEISKSTFKTPGTPGFVSSLQEIKDKDVLPEKQMTNYRSGVGILLYLQKLSPPDISNPVRALSKCLTKATATHYQEML